MEWMSGSNFLVVDAALTKERSFLLPPFDELSGSDGIDLVTT
jgi:hypothetical protein